MSLNSQFRKRQLQSTAVAEGDAPAKERNLDRIRQVYDKLNFLNNFTFCHQITPNSNSRLILPMSNPMTE